MSNANATRRHVRERDGEITVTLRVDADTAAWLLRLPIDAPLRLVQGEGALPATPAPVQPTVAPVQTIGVDQGLNQSTVSSATPMNPEHVQIMQKAMAMVHSPPFQQFARIETKLEGLPANALEHTLEFLVAQIQGKSLQDVTTDAGRTALARLEQRFVAWAGVRA